VQNIGVSLHMAIGKWAQPYSAGQRGSVQNSGVSKDIWVLPYSAGMRGSVQNSVVS
jgi:hypothetical protein